MQRILGAVALTSEAIAEVLELVVAAAANPVELNALGTAVPDWRLARTNVAGSDEATLYRLDTSSDAVNAPYVMASATAGLRWVAIAGRYMAGAATAESFRIGSQPQTPENTALWVNYTQSGATVARGMQSWLTYAGAATGAATGIDGRAFLSGSGIGLDHIVAIQSQAQGGSFTGTVGKVSSLATEIVWNTSGTATNAYQLYMAGYTGASLANITNKWGIYQVGTETNFFGGRADVVGVVNVGTNDTSSYLGISRFTAGYKFSIINAGTGTGNAQVADTGLQLAVRTPANAQFMALTCKSSGDVSVPATTAASSSITGAFVVGDGVTAATNVGIGGGVVYVGTSLITASASMGEISGANPRQILAGYNSVGTSNWTIQALQQGIGYSALRLNEIAGDVVVGAALATTATSGFLYVPACPGTPTGVPAGFAGTIPITVDSTNHRLYFYSGGAWRNAGP